MEQMIILNADNYYKFVETDESRGCYYFVSYEPQTNAINIFFQNNFTSFAPKCKVKAKGESLYEPKQFLKDFGLKLTSDLLQYPRNYIFSDMILRKFDLRVFQR